MAHGAAVLLGLSLTAGATAGEKVDSSGAPSRLSQRTILFGHQSVGANILDGLRRMAAAEGAPLRIVELARPAPLERGALNHAHVERNGDPRAKLASFERLLLAAEAAPPDVALLKFCWTDLDGSTDPARLFEDYAAALASLERRYPRTRFVHVTVPLTALQGGARGLAKRLLGRAPGGLAENARREEFNERMRARYAGKEPVFDLARLEAAGPDGTIAAGELGGRRVLALAPGNTDDGGHLVPAAQDRIARALAVLLATVPQAAALAPVP